MRRSIPAVLIAALLSLAMAPTTGAKAPSTATVLPGSGMAGVTLGQRAKVKQKKKRQVVRGPFLRGWGKVDGFCFEGDSCTWKVRGGGSAGIVIDLATKTVAQVSTTTPGWVTPEGIHAGSPAASAAAAYPTATVGRYCLPPYGAEVNGYLQAAGGPATLFEVSGDIVSSIRVLEAAPPAC